MRVRCTDNHYANLTLGKVYEVLKIDYAKYWVMNDVGQKETYWVYRFEIVEEDKVEQVKIVRKLEDLDGLENGYGTVIEVYDKILSVLSVCEFDMNIFSIEDVVKKLKCMGFKFRYNPLRTVEEIKSEIDELKSIRFVLGEPNWFLTYDGGKNVYTPAYATKYCSVCEKYMEKEKAQAYADELNEIIGAYRK